MTQEELSDFKNLQTAFDELNRMYEALRADLMAAHEAQKQGAVFMFKNGVEKFIPVFATARGMSHEGKRPYKVMLTFDETILREWILQCQYALDGSQTPDPYIPTTTMPTPPKEITDKG